MLAILKRIIFGGVLHADEVAGNWALSAWFCVDRSTATRRSSRSPSQLGRSRRSKAIGECALHVAVILTLCVFAVSLVQQSWFAWVCSPTA